MCLGISVHNFINIAQGTGFYSLYKSCYQVLNIINGFGRCSFLLYSSTTLFQGEYRRHAGHMRNSGIIGKHRVMGSFFFTVLVSPISIPLSWNNLELTLLAYIMPLTSLHSRISLTSPLLLFSLKFTHSIQLLQNLSFLSFLSHLIPILCYPLPHSQFHSNPFPTSNLTSHLHSITFCLSIF